MVLPLQLNLDDDGLCMCYENPINEGRAGYVYMLENVDPEYNVNAPEISWKLVDKSYLPAAQYQKERLHEAAAPPGREP